MDPAKEAAEVAPVDIQPTETTDEDKTKRLTIAEKTAPTTSPQDACANGQQTGEESPPVERPPDESPPDERPQNESPPDHDPQPPLEDFKVADTDSTSVEGCEKDSKLDKVHDSSSNSFQVQIETTNKSDEKSSVAIESNIPSSFDRKSDDGDILTEIKPRQDPSKCLSGGNETASSTGLEFTEKEVTEDGKECGDDIKKTSSVSCEGKGDEEMSSGKGTILSLISEEATTNSSSEEKVPSTIPEGITPCTSSDDKIARTTFEGKIASTTSDDKIASTTSEDKIASTTSEDKIASTTSEESSTMTEEIPPTTLCEEKIPITTSEENILNTNSEEITSNLSSEEKIPSTVSEETTPNTSFEEKTPNTVSKEVTPTTLKENISSTSSEEKIPDTISKEIIPSTSSEEKFPSTEDITPTSEEKIVSTSCEEKIPTIPDEFTPSTSSEEKTTFTKSDENNPSTISVKITPTTEICSKTSEEKATITISEEMTFSTSPEEKISNPIVEEITPTKSSEEKIPCGKTEDKIPNSISEEITPSASSEEMIPNTISDNMSPTTTSAENDSSKSVDEISEPISGELTLNSSAEEKIANTSSEEKIPNAISENDIFSEEITVNTSSEEKADSQFPKDMSDENENAKESIEVNNVSASPEEEENDGKIPSSSSEKVAGKKILSSLSEETSNEEKNMICGEKKSSEKKCDENDENLSPSEDKCDKEIGSSAASEKRCDVEIPSPGPKHEEKCPVELPSTTLSEHKSSQGKSFNSATELNIVEEKTHNQPTTDDNPEKSDLVLNSGEEKVCSDTCEEEALPSVENNEEQQPTECKSDVKVVSSPEAVDTKVDDRNENLSSLEEDSQQDTDCQKHCKSEDVQDRKSVLEKCDEVNVTENVCQLADESSKTKVDVDVSEEIPKTNNEDDITEKDSVTSAVDVEASAESQCASVRNVEKFGLLEIDNKTSELQENEESVVSDTVPKDESEPRVVVLKTGHMRKEQLVFNTWLKNPAETSDDSTLLCHETLRKSEEVFDSLSDVAETKCDRKIDDHSETSLKPSNDTEHLSTVDTVQSTSDKKVDSNSPMNVADEKKGTTASLEEKDKPATCGTTDIGTDETTIKESDVSNSQPPAVSSGRDTALNAAIQKALNKKFNMNDSLFASDENLTTPIVKNIVMNTFKDSVGRQLDEVSVEKNDIPVAAPLPIDQSTKHTKSGIIRKPVKRKSTAKLETNPQNVDRNPPPILLRSPIASTSKLVENLNSAPVQFSQGTSTDFPPIASTSTNFNMNSAPVKLSQGTSTDFPTDLTLKPHPSNMDVQGISEIKPTNTQTISSGQLQKNLNVFNTIKPVNDGIEMSATVRGKPKKVSIDCQVDESELSPIIGFGPFKFRSKRKTPTPPPILNPNQPLPLPILNPNQPQNTNNNHILVTVRGTFANATSHQTPAIPVKIDGAVTTAQNQQRISEAVKFFFQGPNNLDRFFASPNTQLPNCAGTSNMIHTKEQASVQEHDKTKSKKKSDRPKMERKFTPILPKPPGFLKSGDHILDKCKRLEGQVLQLARSPPITPPLPQQSKPATTTLVTSCGDVKISVPPYALESIGGVSVGGGGGSKLHQVVDKLYLAQDSVKPPEGGSSLHALLTSQSEAAAETSSSKQATMEKIDLTIDSPKKQGQPTQEFLSNLKLPSNLTVIPQKVKKQKLSLGSVGQTNQPLNDKVEGSVFAKLQKLGTVIELERDANDKLVPTGATSRSETSSPDYAQCLRVLDNLTQAGQILASIKKVNPKTAAKSKMNLKPIPSLKKLEVPCKPNLLRRSSLPSDAINTSSPGLSESTEGSSSEFSSRAPVINLNDNEHCMKIASNPELTIIHKKPYLSQVMPPAAKTPPPTIVPVVAAGIECPPLPKILHFEQQLNCPPTISITTEESGLRKEAENIFVFQLDVSQVREKSEGEQVLNCDICSVEYFKVASLKRHYLRKHINVRYISDQDKKNYLAPSKNKIAAESSSQKSNAEEDESMKGLYKCSSCRKCFDEKNDLKNHMFEQHILGSDEFKTFDCSKCFEQFDNLKDFVAHRKICSQKSASPPLSHHLCLYCDQSFVNVAARNKHHNKFHHFKKKYQKCFVCNSDKYRDKSSLFKHMCNAHKEKYFGCENCHFRFGSKAELDKHNRVKHGLKKAVKKSSRQSSTNEETEVKLPANEDNKIEDIQLPSESKIEKESSEIVEKVETETKVTKNGNTEVNRKYELAKMLVRVGPPNTAEKEKHGNESVNKTDSKAKNDNNNTKAASKKPEPKAATKDNKSKSEETKDIDDKGKLGSTVDDKVVENNEKVESKEVESNVKVGKKKKKPASSECSVCNKVFCSIGNMTRHQRVAHGINPRKKSPVRKIKIDQKMNVFTESQTHDGDERRLLHDVYSNAQNPTDNENNPNSFTRNVKENLLHHLDGKLDSQEVLEHDVKSRSVPVPKRRLSFSASFSSVERGKVKDEANKEELPISPKSSIEKYSFPKNYDGCGGLTSYLKDMSHLDLFTQKAMRFTPQNACFESGGASASEFRDIPTCLELVKTERSDQDDVPVEEVEFSGEWTRPRRYICSVCNYCTGELWDIEEHKLALHPNVWCPHHEVADEEAESWQVVYCKRQLSARGVLAGAGKSAAAAAVASSSQLRCSKCSKVSLTLPDFHRHILDCGGDTTWAITMLGVSSPGNRRNRKWRPFGSRRRRQQGRRGLKRNIPNTPAKQPGMKIRTKPGDMETIQKMIANLPAKRISRRVFADDNEVKTRSQGTISSNRMLRKRLKGSIYSTPFTYQHNKTALAKKQAAKLLKPKLVTNGSPTESPNKDDKNSKPTAEPNDKPQTSKTSLGKEPIAESPSRKKPKTSDKSKAGTSEKSVTVVQGKNTLKRDHSKVEKSSTPGKEDNSGAQDAKKKAKVKHNVFNVKEGSSAKNVDKTAVSGKNKIQAVEVNTSGDNKQSIPETVDKNEKVQTSTSASTTVVKAKATSGKPTKQDADKQKRCSDDFKKSVEDLRKRNMCVDGNLIMCSGCGTQFDNSSACQRHMKKCSYCTGKAAGGITCAQCNTSFSSESLKQAHVCDDRAMPQLSPEEPYPDQVPALTQDIPVLSPEEIGKNKNEENTDSSKKGSRLTRSESRASIAESIKSEKGESPVTRNSRSGMRQKADLNKSVQDETSKPDNKQASRLLRQRSTTNLSRQEDEPDDSKITAVKKKEESDAKIVQKSTPVRGRKRPHDEDEAETDKDDEESSVKRETRQGLMVNKSSSNDKDEMSSNENRRKSMRFSLPNESSSTEKKVNEIEKKGSRKSLGDDESQKKTDDDAKKILLQFMKETSETGERQGKRFLCEVCNKIIMEIYLRKHVESGAHERNVEMRRDFDNLFPDAGKFIKSCEICNISFDFPFLSYKHQLQYHEDSLMELIETSMIEPMKKEVVNNGDNDDELLIKTKQNMIGKKRLEAKRKVDDSSSSVGRTSSKSKTNTVKDVETEKSSAKRKTLNSSISDVNGKAVITFKKLDETTPGNVTMKTEDDVTEEKRSLRARRNSLPNEPTSKSEDNMILNPELSLLREGRRSSLRLDSSLAKAKESIEHEKSEESTVTNSDLQLRGKRSLAVAGSSNMDTNDRTKSLDRSSSVDESSEECAKSSEDDQVKISDTTEIKEEDPLNTCNDIPATESSDGNAAESEIVHETTEFNRDGKTMVYCFICDRSVGKSAYKKHSNSVVHNQNTKLRKEFQEKHTDSKIMTCTACPMDFTHPYLCFRHIMEMHRTASGQLYDSARTTRSLSSKEEKEVTTEDTNKNISTQKETPTTKLLSNNKIAIEESNNKLSTQNEASSTQHSSNNKISPMEETPSSQTISNNKTPNPPPKKKKGDIILIDPKNTVLTTITSKEVVSTTVHELNNCSKSSASSTEATDPKNTDEPKQNVTTGSSKKSSSVGKPSLLKKNVDKNESPISPGKTETELRPFDFPTTASSKKSSFGGKPSLLKKNVDKNDAPISPAKTEVETSPFDFVNETSAPILSYREATQSKSKKVDRKSSVQVSTRDERDNTAFNSSKKTVTPLSFDEDMTQKNKEIVVPKLSTFTEMASTSASSILDKKSVVKNLESFPRESSDEQDQNTEKVTKEGVSVLESLLTSNAGQKTAYTLFCTICHKRVKTESLQKHSTSTSHKINYDQSNYDYEVPSDCDQCLLYENHPFVCRAHQKSVLKLKKRRRKTSDDESSKKFKSFSLLGKMSKKKLSKLKRLQKLKQSEKLAETKINRLKKMKINNWQVSVVESENKTSVTSPQPVETRTTSEFDCLLCHKQFNSALLLVNHQSTTSHKMNASRHALQNNPLPTLPSTIPSLVKTISPSPATLTTPPAPSPNESERNLGFLGEAPPAFPNTNNAMDQDLSQAAGEAILAYGWQDTDWSSMRNASGWDNQSIAGSSSSGAPDNNMSAFWETDVTSSFMGGRSSLGSILDSVNKILADPDVSTYPTYNLTELQSEVGAYHDHLLYERSNYFQDMGMRNETGNSSWSYPPSVEDVPPSSAPTFMDLDNQPPPPSNQPPNPHAAEFTATDQLKEQRLKKIKISADLDKMPSATGVKTNRSRRKSSVDSEGSGSGSGKSRSKPLGARQSLECEPRTACPTCGRYFLGHIALQFHMASCSNACSRPEANISDLKRKVDNLMDNSLVCQQCKEIMNSREAMKNHICEHRIKIETKTSDAKAGGADKEGAEKFKSKMSIALGSLLDKALNNLLGAKNQDHELNTGAIQLLGKLCAVRRKSQLKSGGGGGGSSADLDHRTLTFKTTAKLRSLMAGDHNLPKLPWLGGVAGGSGTGAAATGTVKPGTLPPPETLVDHLAMMLADGKPVDNSYACPVCGQKFSMPSARNNHMYLVHQEAATSRPPRPPTNDQRPQSSHNHSNPAEKDYRGFASSSYDSEIKAEDGEGQQSAGRPICSDCGLAMASLNELVQHNKDVHLPVSENIIDSTVCIGQEHLGDGGGKKSKKTGEKSLPGLEPITAPVLRKRSLRRGESQEEEKVVEDGGDEEADDGALRKKGNKTASKHRLAVLAPEDVRVKAEAALRELSLQKTCNKSSSNDIKSCKYGNYRYSLNTEEPAEIAAPMKARQASIAHVDKKWKTAGCTSAEQEKPAACGGAPELLECKVEPKVEVDDLPQE
ncbi:uncharacterized protein LOC111064391 isoform X2 [Nilaparvata lugens]|uniref:uncharacterized protein LOC111064391 isoform X2 n=1 Tax=Nilaparvata lugens TaxID=108931 RepID=UPI00193CABCD|nr:uncharacterized protein LOC111064391 isoform X2 [Nilaparvata lugens]